VECETGNVPYDNLPDVSAQPATQAVADTSFADFFALSFEQRFENVARHTVQENAAHAVDESANNADETTVRTAFVRETGESHRLKSPAPAGAAVESCQATASK